MRIQTLARSLAATTGLALVLMASPAQAQLVSPDNLVSATNSAGTTGRLTISNPNATTANINVLSPVVVSNWTEFNVPQATTLNIANGSGAGANASLLARVVGGRFSDMGGTVNANNVNLWLLNPNGVLFGNDTSVNAKSLFVSTLEVSDAEFFDYYHGTNSVGNGDWQVRFSGNAASTVGIHSPANARFSTDGTLLFAGPALDLDGTFNAGTGSAAFLAANDFTVGLSAGSPVAFSISAGTSVAAQRVGGSVSGKSADFLVATSAGVTNAMLTVDANVATTATAGANGIILQTVSGDSSKSSVTVNGTMQSTGFVRANPGGDLTINADVTGNRVTLSGSNVAAKNVTATAGNIQMTSSGQIGVDTLTASGDINLDGSNATSLTLNGNVTAGGDVTFQDGVRLSSGSHTISGRGVTFNSTIVANASDDVQLSVKTSSTPFGLARFGGLISNVDRLAVDALDVPTSIQGSNLGTIAIATDAGNLTISNSGPLTMGTVDGLSGINVASGDLSIIANGVDFQSNVTTPGNVDIFVSSGAITQAATAGIRASSMSLYAGSFESTIVDTSLSGANQIGSLEGYAYGSVALNNVGNITLNTFNAASGLSVVTTGNMTISGPVTNSHSGNLSLAAGGNFTMNSDISASHRYTGPGNVSLTSGGLMDRLSGTIVGNDIALRAPDFAGGILTRAVLNELRDVSVTDTLGGLYVSSMTDLSAERNLTIATLGGGGLTVGGVAAGTQASGIGNVTLASTGSLDINGNIAAAGDTVTLTSAYGINQTGGGIAAATLTGSAGTTADLESSNTIQSLGAFGAGQLYLSNTGNLTVTGPVTASTGHIGVNTSGNLTVNGAMTSALITSLMGSNIALNAAVSAPQSVELMTSGSGGSVTQTAPITAGNLLVYGSGANFVLANAANQINALAGGTIGSLNLGTTTGLSVNSGIDAGAGAIAIQAGGPLMIGSLGGLSGSTVTLSTPGAFINNSGADAITASNRWLVYSAAPAGNTFGGLNSGNTAIWNATLATRAPGTISGNRYVFAYQPTLTVASTDVSKVYGTDLTGALDGNYAVSGLQAGVAGAYLGDTLASVLSGTPTITSAGAAANADVAGGPYAMNMAQGTLAVGSGYSLVLSNAGRLTVTPKAIGAAVGADDKTYDGTTAATGTLTLTGVLAGDSVGTSGTTYAFTNKNAGTDKTVTVSGTLLTGADAGNYTLTVPASVLADIAAKAISGTASANGKTYDGTTAATGSVTLSGVFAGDSVGTGGTTFAFTDKNAGTGKTVLVSGTTLIGADAGNYTLTVPASTLATIVAKAISGTVTANSKTYDGTTAATGSVALNGVVAGDSVGTGGTTFAFTDKNAGTGKTVTVSGTTLTGADASNYTLSVPATALADILAKAITATVTADGKTYDGTTAATGNVSLSGVVSGDAVAASGTVFTFSDKNAGTGKAVTVSGTTLTGADAGNYTLSIPATALADIVAKAISGTVTANTKIYDGTTAATGSVALNGVVAGDSVGTGGTTFAFTDKNAGTGKTVTVSGTTLTGADASNYTLSVPATALADILAKAITATVTADGKTYDGTTAATGNVSLSGVVSGDAVAASGTVFTFSDKNAGTGKAVTVSGTTLTGADAGNYTLSIPATALADIVAKSIGGTVSANDKTYDGTTAATGTVALTGVVAGDAVTAGGTVLTFSDKNAGVDKTVTVSGTVLSGADAGNYVLTLPATTIADIFAKAISATVAANSKTYDGTTAATGSVSLSGVVSGDAVAATGTTFAFADKNAGANKTVTVTGTMLSGADAGNYTLAIPATTLASIFAKAITATVTANAKTYDGTTAGSGSVALSGVVAGDAVGTAGTTFTFADKDADANKTVTLAGTALTGADAGNYTLSVPTSALASILQRALLIAANDATKMAGDPDPALTYTVSGAGLVAGDSLTGVLEREAGTEAGDYAITQGSLTAGSNYAIDFTPGVLKIEGAPVANVAPAGQNALRALPLPSEGKSRTNTVLVIDADSLCPAEDKACRVN